MLKCINCDLYVFDKDAVFVLVRGLKCLGCGEFHFEECAIEDLPHPDACPDLVMDLGQMMEAHEQGKK